MYRIQDITSYPAKDVYTYATIAGLQNRLAALGYGEENARDLEYIDLIRKWSYNGKQYRIVIEDDGELYKKMVRQKFGDAVATFNADPFWVGDYPSSLDFVIEHDYEIDDNPDPALLDIAEEDANLYYYYVSHGSWDGSKDMRLAIKKSYAIRK